MVVHISKILNLQLREKVINSNGKLLTAKNKRNIKNKDK